MTNFNGFPGTLPDFFDELARFRNAVATPQKAEKLQAVLEAVRVPPYTIGTRHYKRLPKGYEAKTDFQAEMLLYNSLTARMETPVPDAFFTEAILEFSFKHFRHMAPVNDWLIDAGVV